MQIFIGFRPHHIKLRAEDIEGRIGLVIIEDEQQFLRHRRQFAFATATRFPHACSGCEPFFVRFLLCCLIDVAEDGQQVIKLVLGQSGQGFHLTVVSDLQPHRWAPSMTFWRIAYLIIYWGTTLLTTCSGSCSGSATTPQRRSSICWSACCGRIACPWRTLCRSLPRCTRCPCR